MVLIDTSDLTYQHSARIALLAWDLSWLLEDRTALLKFLAFVLLQPETLQAQGVVPVCTKVFCAVLWLLVD